MEGGAILGAILKKTSKLIAPQITADTLERFVQQEIKKAGAKSAFLNYDTGYMGKYPAALCVSLNDEVVHGIPSEKKIFQKGDIVGIDCGIWYKGLCLDAAITVPCGAISEEAQKLLTVTQDALAIAINKCRPGNYVGDISIAVQRYIDQYKFCIIKTLVGHGVGYAVHEEPQIPNFFPFNPKNPRDKGEKLKQGMTLAIEPMISISSEKTKKGRDGYAAATSDGSLAAHFEHTIAITNGKPLILTKAPPYEGGGRGEV